MKPSNILVDKDGRYVLVDFGLVHDDEAETITRSGEMVGTLNYMSPEQVSRRRMDARTDVYSLGVTLYEVLTLRMPFKGGSDHAVQNAILFEEPLPPRKLNPRINHDLETILSEFYRDSSFQDDVALAVALLYDSLGEDGEALGWVDRIKENANRERNRAAFFFRMNRIDKAAEAGKKAVALDPNDALAHMWLGLALFGQHRHEEAGDALREAARLDPENPWPHLFLGNNYGLIRYPDEAIAEYREAIRLDPRNSLAH